MNRAVLKAQLVKYEGIKLRPYIDSTGHVTIGIGRNLDVVGISENEARILLENDINRVETGLRNALPWFYALDEPRQAILMQMAFNLGVAGLLEFKHMLAAVEKREYDVAAAEMMASSWARQVGRRAVDLAETMRRG